MIYFVQDSATYHVKIGYTNGEVEQRIDELQVGNPRPIVLLMAIPGTRDMESFLHGKFSDHRECGEWFRPHPELMNYLLILLADELDSVKRGKGISEFGMKIQTNISALVSKQIDDSIQMKTGTIRG